MAQVPRAHLGDEVVDRPDGPAHFDVGGEAALVLAAQAALKKVVGDGADDLDAEGPRPGDLTGDVAPKPVHADGRDVLGAVVRLGEQLGETLLHQPVGQAGSGGGGLLHSGGDGAHVGAIEREGSAAPEREPISGQEVLEALLVVSRHVD